MSSPLLIAFSITTTSVIAALCYVLLYQERVLVIQRSFFFRLGTGALIAAIVSITSILVKSVPLRLAHAVLLVSIAAAIHTIREGIHPKNKSWFYLLFRS